MGGLKLTTPGWRLACFASMALVSALMLETEAYSMQETCAQVPNKAYIGNPTDCSGWGYCENNQLVASGKCGTGLLYNYKTGTCDYADKVECGTSASSICSVYKSPIIVASPSNCSEYIYCNGQGGWETGSCPRAQVFNGNSQSCVWEDSYTCASNSICALVQNNLFVGDPNQCGNYIQCQNGQGQSKKCNPGYYFNVATGSCQNQNPCGPTGPNDGLNTATTPPLTDPSICKTGKGTKFYVSDGLTCYGFYYCETTTGPGKWGACKLGLNFGDGSCGSPVSKKCTFNRCANINLQFVAKANSKCNSYYYCQNQKQVQLQTCPTDYPFFNEISQKCVQENPGFPICAS